ncbi:MAG: hypothetical protein IJI43_01775 [Bacilli bacterium]|nr:hypothetical protein [Bacilli bacterium]
MSLKKIFILPILLIIGMLMITNVKAAGFNVTRNVTSVSNPVTNTFTYSVEASPSNPATVAPPAGGTVVMTNQAISGNIATKTVAPLISENAWKSLNYPQPGTYKFIVTETGSTNTTLYPLDNSSYTVTIYVVNEMQSGIPTGNLTATYIGSQKNGSGTKIDGNSNATFTSEANLSQIKISGSVTGDAAQVNEYFKYLVTINGNSGDTYTITGQDANVSYGGSTIPTSNTYTVGSTNYVYLKAGQTVTIGLNGSIEQIPVGVTYSIVQQDSEDYHTYINGSTTESKTTGNMTVSNTVESNAISFVNNKDGDVPTGIVLKVFPFIVLLIISGIGLYIISNPKENKDKKVNTKK